MINEIMWQKTENNKKKLKMQTKKSFIQSLIQNLSQCVEPKSYLSFNHKLVLINSTKTNQLIILVFFLIS